MHMQKAFSNRLFNEDELTVSSELCNVVLSLPMHPYLSYDDIIKVTEIIKNNL